MSIKNISLMVLASLCLLAGFAQNASQAQRTIFARKAHAVKAPRRTARRTHLSDAQTRAHAMKRLNDYNYVKHFGPISGPMYRSTKW